MKLSLAKWFISWLQTFWYKDEAAHLPGCHRRKPFSLDPLLTLRYILTILFEYCSGGIEDESDGYNT